MTFSFFPFSLYPPHCCTELTVFVCSEARWKRRIQLSGNLPTLAFVSFSFLSLPSHSLCPPFLHPSCPFWIRQMKVVVTGSSGRAFVAACLCECVCVWMGFTAAQNMAEMFAFTKERNTALVQWWLDTELIARSRPAIDGGGGGGGGEGFLCACMVCVLAEINGATQLVVLAER